MIPVLHGVWASGGLAGAFEHIETQTVGSGGAASVTFSSIPGTYKHLQIRATGLIASGTSGVIMRFNGDSASNYFTHTLGGNGTSAYSDNSVNPSTSIDAYYWNNSISGGVLDILDYASTSKFKTSRVLNGFDNNGSGFVMIRSGLWRSTSAVTQIVFSVGSGVNLAQHSTLALYGVK